MTRRATGDDEGGKLGQILAAAHAIFLDLGYAATSMDAVSRHAGISKATLYAYFDSKDALFTEMVKQGKHRLTEAVRSISAETGIDGLEALRRAGQEFLRFATSPDALALFRTMIGETSRFPQLGGLIFNVGRSEVLEVFIEALRRCDAEGSLRVPDPEAAARQFMALVKSDLQLRCLLDASLTVTEEQLESNAAGAVALMKGHYRP
jgi:AcrR family transcriptional regulator